MMRGPGSCDVVAFGPRPKTGTPRPDFRREKSPVFDPEAASRDFPARWRSYLRAQFPNHMMVAQVFHVSERAARKWWEGDGSCRGDKVAAAMALHPREASIILFPRAA